MVALGAGCADVHALSPAAAGAVTEPQAKAPASKGAGLEQCEMHVDYDEGAQLFHAVYDNEHCGAGAPRWVAIDYWVDQVDLAVTSAPDVKPTPCTPELCNVGAYMRPVLVPGSCPGTSCHWVPYAPGKPYAIQARSDEGGGRATVYVTWSRGGSLTVTGAK